MRLVIATETPGRFLPWMSFLERAGVEVRLAAAQAEALRLALAGSGAAVVLSDPRESSLSGRKLRVLLREAAPGRPIGLLAAIPAESLGSLRPEEYDDVLQPDASPQEVLYRVRRLAEQIPARRSSIDLGELKIDLEREQATLEDLGLDLTRREFRLLSFLARHPNRVFRREDLVQGAWEAAFKGGARSVDTHVYRLRRKLGRYGRRLQSVRGVGYRLST